MSQEELDKRLNKNGWAWFLFSNLTPGIIRLQMGAAVETLTEWRKCFEAPTLEEAVTNNACSGFAYRLGKIGLCGTIRKPLTQAVRCL